MPRPFGIDRNDEVDAVSNTLVVYGAGRDHIGSVGKHAEVHAGIGPDLYNNGRVIYAILPRVGFNIPPSRT